MLAAINRQNTSKLFVLCILFCVNLIQVDGQEVKLFRAQNLYKAKNYEQAIKAIDSAVAHPVTSKDYVTWTTRAYIYFAVYKGTDKNKLNSRLRDTIISSLQRSIDLHPDSAYIQNNKKLLTVLASGYFN